MRRLTVLFFDLDAQAAKRFEELCDAFRSAHSQKLRAVASTSRYANLKYSAGAGQGLKLESATHLQGQGPGIAANIQVPVLKTGKTTLAFYPDRVLAFQGKHVGAVSYKSLTPLTSKSRFIETEHLPSDASVVDRTWQYVNKNGGPDKRFKNNRQYPVCDYHQLVLTTSDGLDLKFMASRPGAFDRFAQQLRQMA